MHTHSPTSLEFAAAAAAGLGSAMPHAAYLAVLW